jgi:chitin disaccharide deacetylase
MTVSRTSDFVAAWTGCRVGRLPPDGPIILNADDFGLHPDMDSGIVECVYAGALNSISLVVNHDFDVTTLQQLNREHQTRIGLHVTLVGEPFITRPEVRYDSWKQLIGFVIFPQVRRTHAHVIEAEIRAQHDRFVARLGFPPDHIDSHQHVHVFGGIWEPCFALARELGVRIRTPFAHPQNAKRGLPGWALQRLALKRRAQVEAAGMTALPCVGLARAGHNSADVFLRELSHHANERVEVVAHPGVNTPSLQSKYAEWKFDWDAERNALLDPRFLRAVTG